MTGSSAFRERSIRAWIAVAWRFCASIVAACAACAGTATSSGAAVSRAAATRKRTSRRSSRRRGPLRALLPCEQRADARAHARGLDAELADRDVVAEELRVPRDLVEPARLPGPRIGLALVRE